MDKSERFGFSLETDDRTEEERARQRALRKPTVSSSLGLTQQQPKAPMDTDYQEEMEPLKPQIKFNLNFDKWASIHTQKMCFCLYYSMCCVWSGRMVGTPVLYAYFSFSLVSFALTIFALDLFKLLLYLF